MADIDRLPGSETSAGTTARLVLPVLFTLTVFLSASLLFFVQPLFAKLVLPHIGGAPAVWTTAMLFFQVALLGGYVYAHLISRHVPLAWQVPLHLGFWALSLTFLPLSVAAGWQYDAQASTTWQTLSLFALGVGVPFSMLSANAPLLQWWYARSAGPSADDPYFLYGSSNFGSLLALLAFPLLAEPLLGAQAIGEVWAGVFVAFGLFLALSGIMALRCPGQMPNRPAIDPQEVPITTDRLAVRQVGLWVFLAFVPSTLMLAITTRISTDLGAFPLIWVVPLAIYIFSFVITFTGRPLLSDRSLAPLAMGACALMAVLMSSFAKGLPTWGVAVLFMPGLFVVATYAHRTLYKARPGSGHLTVFYISMSVGGAMGGLFNSILAPLVFDRLHEGWLSVLFAAAVGCTVLRHVDRRSVALALLAAGAGLALFNLQADTDLEILGHWAVLLALICAFGLVLGRLSGTPVAVVAGLAFFLVIDMASVREDYLFKDRSFFGTHTVFEKDGLRVYVNGTTVHGFQNLDDYTGRPAPLSYYHDKGPMAQVLTQSTDLENARIAVVGLGVGSLACYRQPGQSWDFYEIDEMVDRVARTPELFSYMSQCAPDTQTHLGDARIVLAEQDLTFDIMVLDAYSSDSIPVHLVTTEAVAMYLERLAKDGMLVFHISNRYYDLSQPLARIARDLGLKAAMRRDHLDGVETLGAYRSDVMVLSADDGRMQELLEDSRWSTVMPDDQRAWTDDHAPLLSALK